jgi:electron transfer flavoprotein alpha subunit
VIVRKVRATRRRQRLVTDDLGQTAVAILPARDYAAVRGADDADVVFFEPPAPRHSSVEHLDTRDDPGRALASARVVVTAGAGVESAENVALCRALAEVLGGELAATRPACRRGLAANDRVVGLDGHRVAPELYIACGASGSDAHLGGVSTDAVIVAVNRDPGAPIFRVASYGIVGNVSEVVPKLIEAARNAPARGEVR